MQEIVTSVMSYWPTGSRERE